LARSNVEGKMTERRDRWLAEQLLTIFSEDLGEKNVSTPLRRQLGRSRVGLSALDLLIA
jgi:hypothetical protein